jgi:UDP-N-acetylmuramoylalanine-D-glutamate ligase
MSLPSVSGPYPLGQFEGVLEDAQKRAKPGDIVLFSPGLTHLPVVNEFERGELYKQAVNNLQKTKN